jgi:hypothetical protein
VIFENDASAAALGEYVHGARRGYRHIVYITVSTGIGDGIIINGEIFHGVAAVRDLLFEPLRRLLSQFVSMIPTGKINILPAELGVEIGVCDALALAKKDYSNTLQNYAV